MSVATLFPVRAKIVGNQRHSNKQSLEYLDTYLSLVFKNVKISSHWSRIFPSKIKEKMDYEKNTFFISIFFKVLPALYNICYMI